MNYAVLIELSRKKIAFRYYRDDAGNVFLPFNENEESMPLAVYCQGSDLQMGHYALSEAKKHSLYAWDNIFDVVKQNGTFSYRGQDINLNEMLLVAIKKYLADFFDRILVKSKGTLEANISTLPLVFLFHPDIEKSDRLFVVKSFRDGGFVNVAALDLGCEIVRRLEDQKQLPANVKMALTMFSDGVDLFVNAIDTAKCQEVKSFRIVGKGVDPRIKVAVDCLWASLDYYTYEMSKEAEYPILSGIASAFLSSDDFVFQRQVMFSDGIERPCYLDKNQLSGMELGTDSKIKNDMLSFISQLGLQESDCVTVLSGSVAYSDYFVSNARAVGPEVIVDKDQSLAETLRHILEKIIAKDFHIGLEPAPPQAMPLSPTESARANRVLRAVAHMTPQQAQIKLLELESQLKKISPVPSDLRQYLNRIDEARKTIMEQPAGAQPSSRRPTPSPRPVPPHGPTVPPRPVPPHGPTVPPRPASPHGPTVPPRPTPTPHRPSKPAAASAPAPLAIGEVRKANEVILKSRSEAPDEAVRHLKELHTHIESLHPSNWMMWSNRLNEEIRNAEQRLARMPKAPQNPAARRPSAVPHPSAAPHQPAARHQPTVPHPSAQPAKEAVFGGVHAVIGGLKNVANRVKELEAVKAQKLFSETFRDSFKIDKDSAIKKLQELLDTLHKMGVHKFDTQINLRIDLLKKK